MKMVRLFFDIESEEKWLNEMSDHGYEFVKRSGFSYEFKETAEKGQFRYCIDIKRIQNAAFMEFLDELNIQLISRNAMFYYYRVPKECGIRELYMDFQNKLLFYFRYMICLLFLAAVNIFILSNAAGPYVLNISIPFIFNLGMLVIVVYTMIRCTKNFLFLMSRKL